MAYNDIKANEDTKIQDLIKEHTNEANNLFNFNWFFSQIINICFLAYPLFASQRDLPFKMFFPYIDELKSPAYYFIYAYQIFITFIGSWMYVQFTTFFTTTSVFSLLQMKTLQHILNNIKQDDDTNEMIDKKLNECIRFHKKIIIYVKELNNFVAYMCLVGIALLWIHFVCFADPFESWINLISLYSISRFSE